MVSCSQTSYSGLSRRLVRGNLVTLEDLYTEKLRAKAMHDCLLHNASFIHKGVAYHEFSSHNDPAQKAWNAGWAAHWFFHQIWLSTGPVSRTRNNPPQPEVARSLACAQQPESTPSRAKWQKSYVEDESIIRG